MLQIMKHIKFGKAQITTKIKLLYVLNQNKHESIYLFLVH